MDYYGLLDVTTELGYQLAMSGAETYRVEESITRIFAAYGITAEVFAIPNCLHVSLETENQKAMTRMRRIGHHGTDLDSVERYNSLSRRICAEKPDPSVAAKWLEDTINSRRQYSFWIYVLGNILGAAGFTLAYKGSFSDTICAAVCGLFVGLISYGLSKMKAPTVFMPAARAVAQLEGLSSKRVQSAGAAPMISHRRVKQRGSCFSNPISSANTIWSKYCSKSNRRRTAMHSGARLAVKRDMGMPSVLHFFSSSSAPGFKGTTWVYW